MKPLILSIKDITPWILLLATISALLVWYWVDFLAQKPSIKSFIYKRTEQGALSMKVHYPADWTAGDQRSIIVFFFGGGWVEGSMEQFRWQSEYFSERGMVAARVDYRVDVRHGTTPEHAVEDGQDAIAWIRSNSASLGINQDKVIAAGGSAGGHIAACTAICNSHPGAQPTALVLLNPVLDLIGASQKLEFSLRELELIDEIGVEAATTLSPNRNITGLLPPTLLLIGGSDPLIVQAAVYRDAAIAAGVHISMKVAENQGHGFFNTEPWRTAIVQEIDQFLVSMLLLDPGSTVENRLDSNGLLLKDASISGHPHQAIQPRE